MKAQERNLRFDPGVSYLSCEGILFFLRFLSVCYRGSTLQNIDISQASQVQASNEDADFERRVRALNRVLRVRDRRFHSDEPEVSLLPSVKHTTCAVARSSSKSDAGSSQNRHGTGPGCRFASRCIF